MIDFDHKKLEDVLETAMIQCLSSSELFARLKILWKDPYSTRIVSRILEIALSPEEQSELEQTVHQIISTSEDLPSKEKARIDRKLRRLILALPLESAVEIAKTFLAHKRKSRRNLGIEVLKVVGVDKELAEQFIARFRETGEQEYLEMIARSARVIPELDFIFLLSNLTERYWRMRVIEGLLRIQNHLDSKIAYQYPFEFTYATGRLQYRENLPILEELLNKNKEDLEFFSIFAWTAGKLGARCALEEAWKHVESVWNLEETRSSNLTGF